MIYNKKIKNFNNNNYLEFNYDKNGLTQTNTVLSRAYGLPKIHKQNYPLRPIISTINSPTHFLSKLIDSDLTKCLNRPKSYIKNSFVLKEKLTDIFIPQGYILLSLDVTSLFANIPVDLVLKSIDRWFHSIHGVSKIPFTVIVDTIKFLFEHTYCQFNNTIYKQIFGTPIGLPISS